MVSEIVVLNFIPEAVELFQKLVCGLSWVVILELLSESSCKKKFSPCQTLT